MKRSLLIVCAGVVALFIGSARPALADGADGRLALVTRKAVVFKDGYALMIKQATGMADASGCMHTFDVPDSAVLGSFWATSAKHRILAMKAEYTDTWKRVPTAPAAGQSNLPNLLNSAVGRQVTLTAADGKTHTGVLIGRSTVNNMALVTLLPGGEMPMKLLSYEGAQPFTLRESQIVSMSCESLDEASSANAPFTRAKRLSFDLGADAAGKKVELTVMYFAPGLRWIPTYRVSGDLKDKADLALQAEILNEAEDLKDVALDLVVGVPHFRFRQTISPLSLEATLRNALLQAAPQLMGQTAMGNQFSNAMFTQRSGEWRRQTVAAGGAAIEMPEELTGTGEQDLFVYSVPKFTLARSGRATTPLWQSTASVNHVYTLDLPVVRHAQHGGMVSLGEDGRHPTDSPLRLLTTQVWHQLELTNASKVPWTTGAAMIMRGDLPIGQDLLTYTPPGSSTLLPMTVAVNMRGTLVEEETSREPNALQWNHHSYTRINKKGTITLTSYRDEPSEMLVSASVAGKVTAADGEGKVRIDDGHPEDWRGSFFWQNNHSDINWKLKLDPGKTVTLTYEVTFYVP